MKPIWTSGWGLIATVLVATISAACSQSGTQDKEIPSNLAVSTGKEISLEYTLRLENTEVVETNIGSDPLIYTQGLGELVPGLETALVGMLVGESKQVIVAPEEGYGRVNPLQVSEIPKELIPQDARQVGTQLQGKARHGQPIMIKVVEVKKDTIMVDFNHPLAGKTLYFEVTVLDIR